MVPDFIFSPSFSPSLFQDVVDEGEKSFETLMTENCTVKDIWGKGETKESSMRESERESTKQFPGFVCG